jgi:hypothetical protein
MTAFPRHDRGAATPLGAAAGLVLLLASSVARADAPVALNAAFHQHCTRCHDSTHDLDLTRVPSLADAALWRELRDRVKSYDMPPPEESGPLKGRVSIDPKERATLVALTEQVLAASPASASAANRPTRHLDMAEWLALVEEVATPLVSAQQLHGVMAERGEKLVDLHEPLGVRIPVQLSSTAYPGAVQVLVAGMSDAACASMAAADLGRPAVDRVYLKQLPAEGGAQSSSASAEAILPFYQALFRRSPTPSELERGLGLLNEVHRRGAGWAEAWTAVCTYYLSGPRALFAVSWK